MVTLAVGAGETLRSVDIRINGMAKTPQLVILPAPNANNITENGQVMAGTIINTYGDAQSWIRTTNDKKNGKSLRISYPSAVASHLANRATLGLCEADLPLQYRWTEIRTVHPLRPGTSLT